MQVIQTSRESPDELIILIDHFSKYSCLLDFRGFGASELHYQIPRTAESTKFFEIIINYLSIKITCSNNVFIF